MRTTAARDRSVGRLLPDGRLLHMGRKDFQIKIRGHRIEAAEVEMALLGCPGVEKAVVAAWKDRSGEARLIAYLIAAADPAPSVSDLRARLTEGLPGYMVPSAFVWLAEFPALPNGKVDRRALPAPPTVRPELNTPYVLPRAPVERQLAAIWSEVLGLDAVGAHDRFLDLGGDSLQAGRIAARVTEAFRLDVPVRVLFEAPTIAHMALVVRRGLSEQQPGASI